MVQLFMDLEVKTDEATQSFQVLEQCTYSKKSLGDSGQHEIMTCDCHEDWDTGLKINRACSEDSGCINRATSVECVHRKSGSGSSLCGEDCQNQRFQKRQYANVAVIQTEKKGYGLRAEGTIYENDFIYEYIGEVIGELTFRERMLQYDANKFKHFYFMMLKKDLFIDATLKGSLARFCNHSCNPNAYVDKWVVGDKLKMGIFAKRDIAKGEEITFDYNVDRYGAQSQPCYCGEPNCIGFMGGKTQTDLALLLPEGISDALGVTPQMEKSWLKENKHLRSKQQADDAIINEMFVKSIEVRELESDSEVSKVMGALLKTQDKPIVDKLIQRIHLTNSFSINSQIIRLHGYKTMSQLIKEDLKDEPELIIKILEILLRWPKVTKNKISSSQIEDVVKDLEKNTENEEIRKLSSTLLKDWGNLQMAYRIPKFKRDLESSSPGPNLAGAGRSRSPEKNIAVVVEDLSGEVVSGDVEGNNDDDLPEGWESTFDTNSNSYYYFHRELGISRWDKPTRTIPKGPKIDPDGGKYNGLASTSSHSNNGNNGNGNSNSHYLTPSSKPKNTDDFIARREEERLQRESEEQFKKLQEKDKLLQQLIIQSQREAEEKRLVELKLKKELEEKERERQRKKHKKKSSSSSSKGSSSSRHGSNPSAGWTHLLAKTVPNLIRKYEQDIGHDNIKSCARDIIKVLAEKEANKKSELPKELDKHKIKKINDFSKTYMEKFLVKYRAKKQQKRSREDDGTLGSGDKKQKA